MRVAITGASGFVGRRLLQALLAKGHEPIAICRAAGGLPADIKVHIIADLAQSELRPILEGADAVVHCAAKLHQPERQASDAADRINGELPLKIAEAARKVGVKRFVQLSSAAAISSSSRPGEIITDDSDPRPTSSYGRAKLAADLGLARQSSAAMPIIALRPPAIFGPGAAAHFRLLMRSAKLGIPLPIGALSNRRSFAFVDNVAEAIITACENKVEGAYIVTDSAPVSTAYLYRRLLQAYGCADRTFRCPEAVLMGVAKAILGARANSFLGDAAFDGSRFRSVTGWSPSISLDKAIAQTVANSAPDIDRQQ